MGLAARKYESSVREGMTVYDCDGEKLGKVTELRTDDMVVEKGLFFPKDRAIDYADISDVRGDEVHLACARDALTDEGRYAEPSDATGGGLSNATEGDVRTIPLAEEEILARKEMINSGKVHVTKGIDTERREVEVPVVHEVVSVERVPASGAAEESGLFERQDIDVPVREERLELEKRPVVKEEVRIRKDAVVENQTKSATVRRETANVETTGRVEKIGGEAGGLKKTGGTRR